MQHVKNAIGGNAMKMLKMHENAIKCTRMRMGKINTTFGKKQHQSHVSRIAACIHPNQWGSQLCRGPPPGAALTRIGWPLGIVCVEPKQIPIPLHFPAPEQRPWLQGFPLNVQTESFLHRPREGRTVP